MRSNPIRRSPGVWNIAEVRTTKGGHRYRELGRSPTGIGQRPLNVRLRFDDRRHLTPDPVAVPMKVFTGSSDEDDPFVFVTHASRRAHRVQSTASLENVLSARRIVVRRNDSGIEPCDRQRRIHQHNGIPPMKPASPQKAPMRPMTGPDHETRPTGRDPRPVGLRLVQIEPFPIDWNQRFKAVGQSLQLIAMSGFSVGNPPNRDELVVTHCDVAPLSRETADRSVSHTPGSWDTSPRVAPAQLNCPDRTRECDPLSQAC